MQNLPARRLAVDSFVVFDADFVLVHSSDPSGLRYMVFPVVKANDKTGMIIPVTVPYDFLLTIMKDIGRDWDIDYTWEIGLTMHIPIVGKFTLPLTKKGTMKLPTLSDIF